MPDEMPFGPVESVIGHFLPSGSGDKEVGTVRKQLEFGRCDGIQMLAIGALDHRRRDGLRPDGPEGLMLPAGGADPKNWVTDPDDLRKCASVLPQNPGDEPRPRGS